MSRCVEPIYHRYQRLLSPKAVQLNYEGLRRLIQGPRPVEEHAPQGPYMAALEVSHQGAGQIRYRVVDQGHQPTDHLQRTPMEPWPLRVGALLVVAAGH